MRVRILEAFAAGIPVVTTTIGLEGIDARLNEDVLVADTPAEFASAVIRLLNDQNLQIKLAENGRKLVENKYDWSIALKGLGDLYGDIGKDKPVY